MGQTKMRRLMVALLAMIMLIVSMAAPLIKEEDTS